MKMRRRIINGSRKCLEQLFMDKLETTITKDPKIANLGGVPLPINRVRGYIRILAARKELATEPELLTRMEADGSTDQDYVWALIYFLLRAGLVKEAAQYVAANKRSISSYDSRFPRYIEKYVADPDRRLPPEMRQAINNTYHSTMRVAPTDSLDPYRMACYKIIGRCELARRVLDIKAKDEEDWLWLQFALAREVNRVEENAGEVFGLEQLQNTVREIGQKYFSSNTEGSTNFGTFFFMQILAGMFEQAVAWLAKDQHSPVAAVHFAIVLAYYGLLRVSDLTVSDILSFTTTQKPRLAFALQVGYYTGEFRLAKPEAAADYLILLCLNADLGGEAGRRQAEICYEALRELVLETREFAQLLGDIRYDGQRIPGAIQQRLKLIRTKDNNAAETNVEFLKMLTIQAAAAADESGRTTDAVLLYHLADEYDTVITICNRALSEDLSVELGYDHIRLEPLKARAIEDGQQANSTLSLTSVDDPYILTKNMFDLYTSRGDIILQSIHKPNRDSCLVLQKMAIARQLVEAGQWQNAYNAISELNMLPLGQMGNMGVIRNFAQSFGQLESVVARNIGDLLMWTITCCGHLRENVEKSDWEDPTRKGQATRYLQTARDLMVFAGLVRFKLPPRVFEALARAGQEVGV
jgi:nuclear pore complex protein Nup93